MRGYFQMNKTDPDVLNSQLKANENEKKKEINDNNEPAKDPPNRSDKAIRVANASNISFREIKDLTELNKVLKRLAEAFSDNSTKESTSVDVKVAKEITNPDLFKTDYRVVSNFSEFSRNWENTTQPNNSSSVKKFAKPKIEINITKQEFNIKLNGRAFPFHPFNK